MTFIAHCLQHGGVLWLCHTALTHVYTNNNKLDMQCMPVHSTFEMYSAVYVHDLLLNLSLHTDVQTISCTVHYLTCKQGPVSNMAKSAPSNRQANRQNAPAVHDGCTICCKSEASQSNAMMQFVAKQCCEAVDLRDKTLVAFSKQCSTWLSMQPTECFASTETSVFGAVWQSECYEIGQHHLKLLHAQGELHAAHVRASLHLV